MTIETSTPRILDGKATARAMRESVAEGCARLDREHGIVPGLTVVLVGEDPASQIYVKNKNRSASKVGMRSHIERLPATATGTEVPGADARRNDDQAVHGILVQLPLPDGIDEHRVIESIHPDEDVDGFHRINAGRFLVG